MVLRSNRLCIDIIARLLLNVHHCFTTSTCSSTLIFISNICRELSLDDKVTGKFSSDEEYSSDADDTDDSSDDNISKSQVRGFPMTDTADDDHDTELDEAVKPW